MNRFISMNEIAVFLKYYRPVRDCVGSRNVIKAARRSPHFTYDAQRQYYSYGDRFKFSIRPCQIHHLRISNPDPLDIAAYLDWVYG